MNNLTENIFNTVTGEYPDFKIVPPDDFEKPRFGMVLENSESSKGLAIQVTNENDIWLRLPTPYAFYSVDDVKELMQTIKAFINGNVFWVVGFDADDKWFETTLINSISNIETEHGITYYVYSWDGKSDTTIYG